MPEHIHTTKLNSPRILMFCAQKHSSTIYLKFQGHNQDLERQLVHNVLPAPPVYN